MQQSEEAFIIGGCRYSKISTFHAELRKLEKSLPDCYRAQFDEYERPYFASPIHSPANLKAALVQVSVSAEIVRLNRPFLGELPSSFVSSDKPGTDDFVVLRQYSLQRTNGTRNLGSEQCCTLSEFYLSRPTQSANLSFPSEWERDSVL
jgi:hypothetical protein